MLSVLIEEDRVDGAYKYWPIPTSSHTGASSYMGSLLSNVLKVVVFGGYSIWPIINPDGSTGAHRPLHEVLIVPSSLLPTESILRILASIGVAVSVIPASMRKLEEELVKSHVRHTLMSPQSVAAKLKVCFSFSVILFCCWRHSADVE